MTIAVLAVQGAFAEHEKKLDELGISWFELRKKEDLDRHYDGLILPGGESTVQGKLLKELGMFDRLKAQIEKGLPVFATCAGLILLAAELGNDDRRWLGANSKKPMVWPMPRPSRVSFRKGPEVVPTMVMPPPKQQPTITG